MSSYCTLFPDKLKLKIAEYGIEYDIGFFCLLHDEMYETACVSRELADFHLYMCCVKSYPEYRMLWILVYRAVRKVGWIFWYWHKLKRILRDVG